MAKRANKTISFLQHYISSCPKDIKEASCKTHVRPRLHVEYAATVWGPATKTGINMVEAVQRSAARFCQNDHRRTSSVTSMIQNLGWNKLHLLYAQQIMLLTRSDEQYTSLKGVIINHFVIQVLFSFVLVTDKYFISIYIILSLLFS